MVWKRPYGDLSNLSWLRKEAGDLAQQDAMLAVDAALPTGPSGGSTPADGTPDGLASLGAAAANGNGAPPPKN